jgi:hypothetical protein
MNRKTTKLTLLGVALATGLYSQQPTPAVVVDQEQPVIDFSLGEYLVGGVAQEAKLAQVVTAGVSGLLVELRLPVECDEGDLIVEIQEVSGGAPDGNVKTSETLAGPFALPPSDLFASIALEEPVFMNAGDRFAIVLRSAGACYMSRGPIGDPYPGGNAHSAHNFVSPGWHPFVGPDFDLPFQTLVEQDDGTPSGALPISCGETQNRNISDIGDVDFYSFDLAVPSRVAIDIDTSKQSTLDSYLGLFDSAEKALEVSDDDPAPGEPTGSDSYIIRQLPEGEYFIGVSSSKDVDFDGGDDALTMGRYLLSLRCKPIDDDLPPAGPPFEIYPGATFTDSPAVAYNRADEEFLVLGHSNGRLSGTPVSTGPALAPVVFLPETLGDRESTSYAVAYSWRTKTFLAIWTDGSEVFGTLIDRRGERIGQPILLYSLSEEASAIEEVDVTYVAKRKQWLVSWQEDDHVSAQLIESSGEPVGSAFTTAEGVRRYSIAYANKGKKLLIIWETLPNVDSPGLYGQFFKRSGEPIGSQLTIAQGTEHFHPAVEFGAGAKRWIVVWARSAGGQRSIEGRRIRGRTLGSRFTVHADDTQLSYPSAAYSRLFERFLVAWTKGRPGRKSNIEARFVRPKGNLVEESFPVSSIGQSLESGGEEFTSCTYRRPAFCLVTWWEGTSRESGRILGSIVVQQDE